MDLFGPLPSNYCLYFYFLSIIGFILLVLSLLLAIVNSLLKKKLVPIMPILAISAGYFVLYFQNRLLYNMCIGK